MQETIKRLHRTKLVPAFMSIAFGIALIIARRAAMDVMVKIAAGMLIVCGVGCVLMYFVAPVKESMQLTVGALIAVIGILGWAYTETIIDFFPILTGITLILNGLSNLAPLGTPEGDAGKGVIVVFSMLMIAGGLFIAFHPASAENMLIIYIGVSYIVNGVFDLILLHRAKNILMS